MFSEERKTRVVEKMTELLGPACILEWCGNTNFFIAELLKANEGRPADLEANIAMNLAFMEILKKFYGVDPEIMELEMSKCYRQLETIINEVSATHNEPGMTEDVLPMNFEERLSQLESMAASMPHIVESGVVEVDEIPGMQPLPDAASTIRPFPRMAEGFLNNIPNENIVDGQAISDPQPISPLEE